MLTQTLKHTEKWRRMALLNYSHDYSSRSPKVSNDLANVDVRHVNAATHSFLWPPSQCWSPRFLHFCNYLEDYSCNFTISCNHNFYIFLLIFFVSILWNESSWFIFFVVVLSLLFFWSSFISIPLNLRMRSFTITLLDNSLMLSPRIKKFLIQLDWVLRCIRILEKEREKGRRPNGKNKDD